MSCSCRSCSGSMTCDHLTFSFMLVLRHIFLNLWLPIRSGPMWDTGGNRRFRRKPIQKDIWIKHKAVIWVQERRSWSCVVAEPETLLTYKNTIEIQLFSAILYRAWCTIRDVVRISQTLTDTEKRQVQVKPGGYRRQINKISWQWNQSQRMKPKNLKKTSWVNK